MAFPMRASFLVAILFSAVAAGGEDAAPPPPFFSPVGTAFTPQIGVVNSGVLQDVQAVVSPDRKYVTLNMGVSNARVEAIREFAFQRQPTLGVVGLPPAAAPAANPAANPPAPPARRPEGQQRFPQRRVDDVFRPKLPSEVLRAARAAVLEQPGMTRVDVLPRQGG